MTKRLFLSLALLFTSVEAPQGTTLKDQTLLLTDQFGVNAFANQVVDET